MSKNNVLDLFCGCGGLSHGFIEAGYEVVAGIDHWQDALDTFAFNHTQSKAIKADLFNVSPKEIAKQLKTTNIDVIIGGPPCQGFSIAGKRLIDDERNQLYKSFVEFVSYFKPKAFIMENVPNIISMGKGAVKDEIIEDFTKLGYTVTYKILLASEYGVPQNRRRAFFVGLKNGQTFDFPLPTNQHLVTCEQAISDLPDETIDDGENYPVEAQSDYQRLMRMNSTVLNNHQATIHTPKTVEIIAQVPDGGNYKDLPEHLRETRKVNIAWTRFNSQKPSFTIDTGHRHHFHYRFNRVPTVRESARLQSFPDSFIFLKGKTSQYKQVGNAVPPLLAQVLAEKLKDYLSEN